VNYLKVSRLSIRPAPQNSTLHLSCVTRVGFTITDMMIVEETVTLQPDVDDTDGLDPAADFDAWRARELARLLRDKSALAERDAEREEIERRRAMPEEQRLREDMEYADATRAKEKGQMGFLQKYYHKGAFHQVGYQDTRFYSWLTDISRRTIYWREITLVQHKVQWTCQCYRRLCKSETSERFVTVLRLLIFQLTIA
jgi:hypothetical protein